MPNPAPPFDPRRDRAVAAAVFAALALLYWTGRSLTFGAGDSPQHVLSALTWSVSRPPGYPLYTALAHFFSRLPLGGAAGAVNGLSGLLHAWAAALFFLLLRRWACGVPAALAATALMALSPLFWYYSEVAEVRALNDLLALAAAYAATVWLKERREGAWLAFAACAGLGLSHHPTFVLLLPAFLYLAASGRPGARRWLLFAALAAACAALPYVVLGLRLRWGQPPAYNPDEVRDWGGVLALALRRRTGGLLGMAMGGTPLGSAGLDPGLFWRDLGWFGRLMVSDLTVPGLLAAYLGVFRLWKSERKALFFWLLWLAGGLLFIAVSSQQMRFGDEEYMRAMLLRFYLLPLLALFALAGFGLESLLERSRPALGWALVAAAAFSPVLIRPVRLGGCGPLMDYARQIVASSGPRDMVLLTSDEGIFAAHHLDLVERAAGDRVFLVTGLFTDPPYIAALARRHPDLVIPRDAGAPSRRLSRWLALNPGRAVYAEPTLRDKVLAVAPVTSARGVLIRAGGPRQAPGETARQAESFLSGLPRCELRDFTQEVYLKKAYGMMAEYYASQLARPQDAALRARLEKELENLR